MELPGRCGDWLDTATVTVQGSRSGSTRRARGGDFYLATSGDFFLAMGIHTTDEICVL